MQTEVQIDSTPEPQFEVALTKIEKKAKSKMEQKNLSYIESVGCVNALDVDKVKKRYSVLIKYRLAGDNKSKSKTVKFGKLADKDFIDHKNLVKRDQLLKRLNLGVSPLSPKWWRINVLNNCETLQDSYADACKKLNSNYGLKSFVYSF